MKLTEVPGKAEILNAHDRIHNLIHKTPVLQSAQLNDIAGAKLFLKCENFQKAGAFKSRGATHALSMLSDEELKNGVATHSSGNHAQALARAASILNTKAYIVMPENAPAVKIAAVRKYGGIISFCKPTLADREATLAKVIAETSAIEIHPYNNYAIIAGQATASLELLDQMPSPDYVLCPVGGGGLLSGTLLSMHYFSPHTKVIACEPEGANDTWQSFKTGKLVPSIQPNTIADGLLTSLGSLTYPIIKDHVFTVLTVNDSEIAAAMFFVFERLKIVIEPSSAVAVAVAMQKHDFMQNKTIGIIISGGNVDLNRLPWNSNE